MTFNDSLRDFWKIVQEAAASRAKCTALHRKCVKHSEVPYNERDDQQRSDHALWHAECEQFEILAKQMRDHPVAELVRFILEEVHRLS